MLNDPNGYQPFTEAQIETLPLVLAGPIVRHVNTDQVSIWMVLRKHPRDVQLSIYENFQGTRGQNLAIMSSFSGDLANPGYEIVQVGKHLHVVLVTARPRGNNPQLSPRQVYQYDIRVIMPLATDENADGPALYLNSPGLITADGVHGLDFDEWPLPSFITPTDTIGNLRIVHGSCRKAHGGGEDALTAVDEMLEDTHGNRDARPQQMFLTGDQIYGDDVADVLAVMIRDTMKVLMGYMEEVPGVAANDERLLLGNRTQLNLEVAKMTGYGAYSKNHSVTLADYLGLYIFAWSDTIWPSVLPQNLNLTNPVDGKEKREVEAFRLTLPKVRRVLANIATYMMFDDHDVTDDWFLNKDWAENVLDSGLGRRIMLNGLVAFALFQSWGNIVDEAQSVKALRDQIHFHIDAIYNAENPADGNERNETTIRAYRSQLDALTLPRLEIVSTLPAKVELTGGMVWNYILEFPEYRVIVLNTRTARGFYREKGDLPAALLSEAAMNVQLPTSLSGKELTIVVSPAPVIGHPYLEDLLQPEIAKRVEKKKGDGGTGEGGASYADLEAWKFDGKALERLLQRLSEYERVVVLSGDVHYAFSAYLQYWNNREPLEKRSVLAQLTSSSIKNADFKTGIMAFTYPGKTGHFGWMADGLLYQDGKNSELEYWGLGEDSETSLAVGENVSIVQEPQWRYFIGFGIDRRFGERRGLKDYSSNFESFLDQFSNALELAGVDMGFLLPGDYLHLHKIHRLMMAAEGRKVIGTTNIGLLRFSWPIGAGKELHHEFWTNLISRGRGMAPMTR
ncbi:MAG TPA: hypothetical protein ENJ82_15680, partial [Bacteroidetes bacterium]|nr:hypothetical protein [Bacteroidota bacterium]